MRFLLLAIALLLIGPRAWGQDGVYRPAQAELRARILSDRSQGGANQGVWRREGERNVALAFGASAVLPGAGQWLNNQRVKAVVAVGLEAAIITGYVVTRQNGLRAEDDFRAFAHDRWNPAQYASWLNDYREYLNDEYAASITAPPVNIIQGVDLTRPSSWSVSDQAAVRQMFDQIQAIERQAFHPETGAAFSHQLPDFGDQQYYELIGKYFQFAPGWDDYPAWRGADDGYLAAIDPEMTGSGGSKPNVSATFYSYADDHAHAQDLLRTASRISLLLVFNHIIAGIDAAVSAKLHNDRMERGAMAMDRLSSRMGLAWDPDGAPVPVVQLSWKLSR